MAQFHILELTYKFFFDKRWSGVTSAPLSPLQVIGCQYLGNDLSEKVESFKKSLTKIIKNYWKFSVVFNPPVTISLSDRPGHFFSIRFLTWSAIDHTAVLQTGFFSFFFSNTFSTGLTDRVLKNPVCENMVWSLTSRCRMS